MHLFEITSTTWRRGKKQVLLPIQQPEIAISTWHYNLCPPAALSKPARQSGRNWFDSNPSTTIWNSRWDESILALQDIEVDQTFCSYSTTVDPG
jgi:hypothetical protein